MKPRIGLVAIAMTLWPLAVSAQQPATPVAQAEAESFPAWAYPWAPDFKAMPDDGLPRHVPDSDAAFTVTQERDLFFVPDWHPGDHPLMPDAVGKGRRPEVRACGSCHRASGTGGPKNASLAGLPAAYIIQQMANYKSGARKFSGPPRSPVTLMMAISKAATDAEIEAAANYFSALKPTPNIKVVETDTVPKTQIARVFYTTLPDAGTEPLEDGELSRPRWIWPSSSIAIPALNYRLCAGRKHRQGRGAGQNRRLGQDHCVRRLPRSRFERSRRDPRYRRTLAKLCRASAL
jgi:cytochrome c553